MNVDTLPTWTERIAKAVASWKGEVSFSPDLMDSLPLEIRMDRVFKDAGVRDLVVRVQELEALCDKALPDWRIRLEALANARDVEDMPENVVND